MDMKRLAIIGAGDLGQQIAYHAKGCGYHVVGFFDDYAKEVLGRTSEVKQAFEKGDFDELMIGIGYKHMSARSQFFSAHEDQIPFAKVIHSSAVIDPTCQIDEGAFIYPGCVLDMNVKIGKNVSLNAGCIIAHDSKIGDHSMLSPGVTISGFVSVQSKVNLGTGTKVIDNVSICEDARTGAGSVIISNIEQSGLYVGVPAKFKKS